MPRDFQPEVPRQPQPEGVPIGSKAELAELLRFVAAHGNSMLLHGLRRLDATDTRLFPDPQAHCSR